MSNNITTHLALNTTSSALAAIALGSPIGAIGGALHGFCHTVTYKITEGLIKTNDLDSSFDRLTKQIVNFSISLFGAWKLGAALGVNMSLKSCFFLNLASIPIGLSIALLAVAVQELAKKFIVSNQQNSPQSQ